MFETLAQGLAKTALSILTAQTQTLTPVSPIHHRLGTADNCDSDRGQSSYVSPTKTGAVIPVASGNNHVITQRSDRQGLRPKRKSMKRLLDPIDRYSEILFGLIMVLTVTGSLSVASPVLKAPNEIVYGAVGCNLAWGIIDACIYLMARLIERGQDNRLVAAVRDLSGERARDAIKKVLPPVVAEVLCLPELETIRHRLHQLPAVTRSGLTARDFLEAAGVFLLVVLATLPVLLPFFAMGSSRTTVRISNAIALVMLFSCGYAFGRHIDIHPLRTGVAMVIVGVVLVGVAIALGG